MECTAKPFLRLVLWIQGRGGVVKRFISALRSLCALVCASASVCVQAADRSAAAHGGAAAQA